MKSILDEKGKNEILKRIESVRPSGKGLWGKMNSNEMLCHCNDQIKLGLGEINCNTTQKFPLGKLFKYLIFMGMPTPKGKIETFKSLKQGDGGTPPTNFANDKNVLIKSIQQFNAKYPDATTINHPAFGDLTKKEWGKLIYMHLDHHLRQFGV
ncbi:MAG: DUF1569 domain-containing protein [bacterium]